MREGHLARFFLLCGRRAGSFLVGMMRVRLVESGMRRDSSSSPSSSGITKIEREFGVEDTTKSEVRRFLGGLGRAL